MAFVLDGSVTMSWCFTDERTPSTQAVLDRCAREQAFVPVIWPLEVVNALIVGERRRRIFQAQVNGFLQQISNLPLTIDTEATATAFTTILNLCRQHNLSAYDAAYLELAMRLGLPLATQDSRLSEAATRAGVRLLS